jgi:hypothetical protein
MKNLLLAISAYFVIILMEIPNGPVLVFFFIISMFSLILLRELTLINKKIPHSFKVRSQTRKISKSSLIFAILWTLMISIFEYDHPSFVFIVLIFWVEPTLEFFILLRYVKNKPFTIFINKNKLISTIPWKQERDLHELNNIKFDRWTKSLNLYFKSQNSVSIKVINYNKKDIDQLLEIIIETSKYEVRIPQNYLDE